MERLGRLRWRKVPNLVRIALVVLLGSLALPGASDADIGAVKGTAYGGYVNVTAGGTTTNYGPQPVLTLPASGGDLSKEAPSLSAGPNGSYLSTGKVTLTTQGTLGSGGSAYTTAAAEAVNIMAGVFTASSVGSTCTASETGLQAWTSIHPDARLVLGPGDSIPIIADPYPGETHRGRTSQGDSYTLILNEQTYDESANWITVTAVHMILEGPNTSGDIHIGQSHCDVTVVASTTSTMPWSTTSSSSSSTTTTVPSARGRFNPLTPARILDTRNGTGGLSAAVGPNATADVQVTGRGGIPTSGVTAVALNVTVTQPTATGFLTLYPSGAARPTTANLNFTPNKTVPNLVVVKVGTGGKVALYNSSGSSHVIFDVAGWYSNVATGNDGRYQPLAPARILDTRSSTGGVRLGPGASLDMVVAGRGGVPSSGAGAAVLNVAVTGATSTSFLSVYPTGASRPSTANVNFNAGDTVSNRVMAKLGTGGKLTIYNNSGSADVIVDVNGYYTDTSVSGTSGAYTALVPARILDTRTGLGGLSGLRPAGSEANVLINGRGGVPTSGVSAVILNVTVTQPAAGGFLTLFPPGTTRPTASDLNYASGETRPNLVVVKVSSAGHVVLYTSASTHVIFDVAGWVAAT